MTAHLVPRDFLVAVQDIKLAILQARSRAARASNAEALKLYFFVGGYVSAKTRKAKWGSGAIDALSERLQVELPGLRGFSATNIKNMRLFFEFWADDFSICHSPSDGKCPLPQDEIRQMASSESALVPIRQMPSAELCDDPLKAFLSGARRGTLSTRSSSRTTPRWPPLSARASRIRSTPRTV